MKKSRITKLIFICSLIIVLSLAVTPSFWLIKAKPTDEEFGRIDQFASIGNKDNIARADIPFTNKAITGTANKASSGYKLTGVKWNEFALPIGFALNPANIKGMTTEAVTTILSESFTTWDGVTNLWLFNYDIGITSKEYGVFDGSNTIAFADLGNTDTIAVTSYWYDRKTKLIVEFDICFNTYYPWGIADNSSIPVMDLQNIATHEFGHALGLGDVNFTPFRQITMFSYADLEEICKRDLEDQDVNGIQSLYGVVLPS